MKQIYRQQKNKNNTKNQNKTILYSKQSRAIIQDKTEQENSIAKQHNIGTTTTQTSRNNRQVRQDINTVRVEKLIQHDKTTQYCNKSQRENNKIILLQVPVCIIDHFATFELLCCPRACFWSRLIYRYSVQYLQKLYNI